jgi:hypothetical protein
MYEQHRLLTLCEPSEETIKLWFLWCKVESELTSPTCTIAQQQLDLLGKMTEQKIDVCHTTFNQMLHHML